MSKVWFTSDEHYDHKNIISYCNRPFRDVEHQIEELISRHNSVVGDEDIVWHLGDFSLNEKTVPKVLPRLKGKHYLITGNHDKCFRFATGSLSATRAMLRYLRYGFLGVSMQVNEGPFLLHHMPYVGDSRHEQRYLEYRPKDLGQWLLHGHIHDLWRVNGRMINVGVDVWNYTPVSYDVLLEIKQDAECGKL